MELAGLEPATSWVRCPEKRRICRKILMPCEPGVYCLLPRIFADSLSIQALFAISA